jgi:ribose transport system permease protein
MPEETTTQASAAAAGTKAEAEAARPGPPVATPPPPAPRRSRSDFVNSLLAKYGLLLAFAVTILIFSVARPESFPTMDNFESILTLAAPALIIAAGLTVVLVMQDFDLSFAGMIGLAAGAVTYLIVNAGWPWGLAMLVVVGMGIFAGVVNGFLVAYLGGASFIITLAMGTILTGVEFGFTEQETIFSGIDEDFANIASSEILGLNTQIWIAAVIALLVWVLLDRTEIGRYMNAIGGNAEAARLSGVRVRQLRVLGFVIVAVLAAVVGLLITSRSASYSPNPGVSFLLPAFAAAFLGSAVFRPGSFNVPGTVVGVLFLGVIQTGLTMLDLETYVINLVQGTILISAVLISRLGQRSG